MLKKIAFWIPVTVAVAFMLAVAAQTSATGSNRGGGAERAEFRVGVYDNRAIAIAWFRSEHNTLMKDNRAEYAKAKKAGDKERMKELDALGPVVQRRLHFQGFGRAPVTELFADVEGSLPDLATETGVDVIAFECNYIGEDVETVDVTLELVALFNPSPETMKMINSTLEQDPVALEELTNDDH